MELLRPHFAFRDDVLAYRPEGRGAGLVFDGLWVAGALEPLRSRVVAIVGPRAPSDGARVRAHALAAGLGRHGACVISGLALGIDGSAHSGALEGGGTTIGVLGGGHRHFYPQRNLRLAEAMIAAGGAVVSPFAPDEPSYPSRFLERNAIVAGLADAVVIVEAAARSGALNTATWASKFSVDTLVFPGDVDRPKAAGCNALIRDGATLVRGLDDVLEALGIDRTRERGSRSNAPAREDPIERAVVRALAKGAAGFDRLLGSTGATTAGLIAALVKLEMDDVVDRRDAFTYALRDRKRP